MSARLADDELLITRIFDAPASLVFALWSKPEHMKRWMGPANFTCPEVKIDFRVGGTYRAMITSPAHGENWFGGVYREIVENKRLVFTFTWDNDGPSAGVETLVTITWKRRAARRSRPSTKGPSSAPSAATAMSAAGPRPSTSLRLMTAASSPSRATASRRRGSPRRSARRWSR